MSRKGQDLPMHIFRDSVVIVDVAVSLPTRLDIDPDRSHDDSLRSDRDGLRAMNTSELKGDGDMTYDRGVDVGLDGEAVTGQPGLPPLSYRLARQAKDSVGIVARGRRGGN